MKFLMQNMKLSGTQTMEKNLQINYYGYFTPFGGYGIANINWVKYLRRLGVDVLVHAKFKPQEGSPEWNVLTEEEKTMFTQPFEKRFVGIIETNPFDFDTNISDVKIANTMCESDHLAPAWAEKLSSMRHIIVPNEFNKRVFEKSGVTSPIEVIPHGIDIERFFYYERPKPEIFTFGILGYLDATDRKGAFDVIRAFASEFEPDEPVELTIHSSDPMFNYYKYFKDQRISLDTNQLSFEEVNRFYQEIDCFVFPSKAEGIGYPPREAMATGLPVILTNWSGLEDIALSDISYPLNPIRLEKRPNFIEQDGNWAIIDIQELMYRMRYVYEHQEEAKLKGKKAAKHTISKYSWEVCALQLKEFLSQYV